MSALFGGSSSLTESIFGPSTASPSSGSDLFAKPVTHPASKRPRNDERPRPIPKSPKKRDGEEGAGARPSIDATINRRRNRSRREILDELTVSLGDYAGGGGGGGEELFADVRGLIRHHGVAIVRGALSDAEVDAISKVADGTERKICAVLEERGIPYDDPVNDEEATCFAELAIRCRGRMDVRHCEDTVGGGGDLRNAELPPLALVDDLAASVLHGAEPPNRVYSGWILSFPGSADQPWHQDGRPLFGEGTGSLPSYAINIFCGLHDARLLELGPTEFIMGSHRLEPADAMDGIGDAVSAVLGKEDILLYDYRICHRGTSNVTNARTGGRAEEGAEDDDVGIVRKVLYLMYARPWFREHLNFGSKSLFKRS